MNSSQTTKEAPAPEQQGTFSVGYRVKSQRGTLFRIWATDVLRDHIIKGVTVNQKRIQDCRGDKIAASDFPN